MMHFDPPPNSFFRPIAMRFDESNQIVKDVSQSLIVRCYSAISMSTSSTATRRFQFPFSIIDFRHESNPNSFHSEKNVIFSHWRPFGELFWWVPQFFFFFAPLV
jgi:hypothetical protein